MKKILIIISTCILISFIVIITIIKFFPRKNDNIILDYKYIGNISENSIVVSDGKKYGYYDLENDKLITNLKYDLPSLLINSDLNLNDLMYKDGLAPITKEDLYGLIDKEGKIVIKPTYETLEVINKNLILVFKNSKYYFIDSSENKLFNLSYEIIENINNNIFIVNDGSKYGLIDNNANHLLNCDLDDIQIYRNDINESILIIAIKNNTKEYYLIENNMFNKINEITNYGFLSFKNKDIYLNNSNNEIIRYNLDSKKTTKIYGDYISIGPFIKNLSLAINNDSLCGYIDEKEKLVIPFEYEIYNTYNFKEDGYAVVGKNGKFGVINVNNKIILPIEYNEIYHIDSGKFIVYDKQNKANIIDKDKNNITNNKYHNIIDINNKNYLLVEKNGLYGVIDYSANEIIEAKYQDIEINDSYFTLKDKDNYIINLINN